MRKINSQKMLQDLEEATLRIMETDKSLGISIMEPVKENPLRVFIIVNDKESRLKGTIVLALNNKNQLFIVERKGCRNSCHTNTF